MVRADDHLPAGEDLARLALCDDLLFDGAGVVVLVKVVVVGACVFRRVEVQQVVGRVVVDKHAFLISAPASGRTLVLVLVDLLGGDQRHLGAEMVVDVIKLADGERHVTCGLNGRTVVVQRLRLSGRKAVFIHSSTDGEHAVAVNQRVVTVVDRLRSDVHAQASGESCRRTVLCKVIERCRLK